MPTFPTSTLWDVRLACVEGSAATGLLAKHDSTAALMAEAFMFDLAHGQTCSVAVYSSLRRRPLRCQGWFCVKPKLGHREGGRRDRFFRIRRTYRILVVRRKNK